MNDEDKMDIDTIESIVNNDENDDESEDSHNGCSSCSYRNTSDDDDDDNHDNTNIGGFTLYNCLSCKKKIWSVYNECCYQKKLKSYPNDQRLSF